MHYFHAVWLKLVDYLILLLKNKIITQQEITNIPSTFDLFGKKKKEVSWMKKYPFWNSHDNIYTVTWSGEVKGCIAFFLTLSLSFCWVAKCGRKLTAKPNFLVDWNTCTCTTVQCVCGIVTLYCIIYMYSCISCNLCKLIFWH